MQTQMLHVNRAKQVKSLCSIHTRACDCEFPHIKITYIKDKDKLYESPLVEKGGIGPFCGATDTPVSVMSDLRFKAMLGFSRTCDYVCLRTPASLGHLH